MEKRRPLKVLMLTSSYPRSKEDPAGIFVRYLAENLTQRGLEVHVLAPAYRGVGTSLEGDVHVHRFQYFPALLQKLAYGSGILHNLRRHPLLWIEVPFFLAMMTFSLLRLLQKENPDLIHAHWVLPQGLIAVFAKLFYKIPVITTAHGSDVFTLKGKILDWLKALVLRSSDAWTSNSRATADAIAEQASLPEPRILPMGVDVNHFQGGQRTRLRPSLPEDELLLLFVGRLVKEKGLDDLLEALPLLQPDLRGHTSLWVVGDGQERSRLERYAQALGINGKVRFWGFISNDLLPNFYAAADLFVLPSMETESQGAEGQGVVLLEAFAARLCVVATRAGGIREVVEDGYTGILVEPRNPRQLAIAVEKLLDNEQLRAEMAENAFARVKKYYGWEKIATAFESLYHNLLKNKNGGHLKSRNTGA